MTIGELKKAIENYADDDLVMVADLYEDVIGVRKVNYNCGLVELKVYQSFPEEWFYEDEEGSRWEKTD